MTNSTKNNNKNNNQDTDTSNRGFASMPTEKVQEIARKGGEARAEQLGHEGYVELGHKGGEARAEQLGHEGYVELGHKGGSALHASRGREGSDDENDQDDDNNSSSRRNQSQASKTDSGNSRGFASQPKEKVRESARKGGENSHGKRSGA